MRWRLFLGGAIAALLIFALPATSGATMPGANGRIVSDKAVEQGEFDFESDLFSVNPDGSGITQLTSGKDSYEAAYSPDGSRLAFGRYDEIVVAAADGSGARTISFGSTKQTTTTHWVANYEDPETSTVYPWVKVEEEREDRDTRSEPSFSPDGASLAVVHYTGTFIRDYVCSVDADNETNCNGDYFGYPYECQSCGSSIETIDANTGAPLATLVPKTSGVYLSSPAYASNGALAYTSQPEGVPDSREILSISAPGAAPVSLAKGEVGEPDFSPDGARVAYASGRHEIGIVAATGGTPAIVSAPPPVADDKAWSTRSPVWSPDGSLIAFGNIGAGGGGGLERYTDGGVFLMHPDGSNMALIEDGAATPDSWQPTPVPPSAPPVPARAVKGKKKLKLNKKGIGVVGKIVCGSSPCALKVTSSKLKVGKKRYGVKAMSAKSLAPGATTQLKIRVKGKALAALRKKHRGRLALTVAVTDATGTQGLAFKPRVVPPAKRHHKKTR